MAMARIFINMNCFKHNIEWKMAKMQTEKEEMTLSPFADVIILWIGKIFNITH